MNANEKALAGLVLLLFGFLLGAWFAGMQSKKQAIDAGVATWQTNPETGAAKFVYLKCEETD